MRIKFLLTLLIISTFSFGHSIKENLYSLELFSDSDKDEIVNEVNNSSTNKFKVENKQTMLKSINSNSQNIKNYRFKESDYLSHPNFVCQNYFNPYFTKSDTNHVSAGKIMRTPKKLLNFKILFNGIGVETRISNRISIYYEAAFGFYFSMGSYGSNFKLYPYILAQPRIYRNSNTNLESGISVDRFSGSYFSPFITYLFNNTEVTTIDAAGYGYEEIISDNGIGGGLGFGFQQDLSKNVFWGYDFGLGATYHKNSDDLRPVIINNLRIGLTF